MPWKGFLNSLYYGPNFEKLVIEGILVIVNEMEVTIDEVKAISRHDLAKPWMMENWIRAPIRTDSKFTMPMAIFMPINAAISLGET